MHPPSSFALQALWVAKSFNMKELMAVWEGRHLAKTVRNHQVQEEGYFVLEFDVPTTAVEPHDCWHIWLIRWLILLTL